MNFNPAAMLKIISAKNRFQKNHPKLFPFFEAVYQNKLKKDTIVEITVTTPEGETLTSNIKIQESDMELFDEMKELLQQQR